MATPQRQEVDFSLDSLANVGSESLHHQPETLPLEQSPDVSKEDTYLKIALVAAEIGLKAINIASAESEKQQEPMLSDDIYLTKREIQMMSYLRSGLSNSEIAEIDFVTEQTVKFHLANIYMKMDVTNRTEALGLIISESQLLTDKLSRKVSERQKLAINAATLLSSAAVIIQNLQEQTHTIGNEGMLLEGASQESSNHVKAVELKPV